MNRSIQHEEQIEIGTVWNYYGCLEIKEDRGLYYWSIENYDGHN